MGGEGEGGVKTGGSDKRQGLEGGCAESSWHCHVLAKCRWYLATACWLWGGNKVWGGRPCKDGRKLQAAGIRGGLRREQLALPQARARC